jgi:hypothetical protein
MRPELPTAVAVDNSASIQPARSIFISWGKSVQISGATSLAVGEFRSLHLEPLPLEKILLLTPLVLGDDYLTSCFRTAGARLSVYYLLHGHDALKLGTSLPDGMTERLPFSSSKINV